MHIYFAAAMRGGRKELPWYQLIFDELKKYGTVLSTQVADATISEHGETDLASHEVHARELERLKKSDVVVADVTAPSLGVGYSVATALNLGKRAICLYRGEHTDKLSGMIKGSDKTEIYTYQTETELTAVITKIFAPVSLTKSLK